MDPRAAAKRAARWLLHRAGGLHGVRACTRSRLRILMYHRFPGGRPAALEGLAPQCAHIRRRYSPVSMADVARAFRGGAPLPKNALAVTVDDGCRDFLLNGYPVFRDHGIPVLVYLVSGFLDRKLWFWWHKIEHALSLSRRPSLRLARPAGRRGVALPLGTSRRRAKALDALVTAVKAMEEDERVRFVEGPLARALGVDLPGDPPAHMAPLSWEEVRRLNDEGVEFGAHTVTHPRLSDLREPSRLRAEIADSKRRIEQETGTPVLHFSYPYGYPRDISEGCVEETARCGLLTATTAQAGLNGPGSHPLRLRRLGVEPGMREDYFKELLAGLH